MLPTKPTLLLLACLLLATSGWAQAQTNPSRGRWEVGVDALSLFEKNTFAPYSLFGRYLLNPDGEKKSHFRARIGYNFHSYLDTVVRGNYHDHDSRQFAFMALVGYQIEFSVFDRSSLYAGADVSFNRDFVETLWDLPNITGFETVQQRIIGLHGVIGYSYSLTQNLRISLESSVSLSHRYYRYQEDVFFYYDDGTPMSGRNGHFGSTRIDSKINPFHQLLVTYKF